MKRAIGYTTGVFDLFHIGHLNILRRARENCDKLIVGVTTDELALAAKGRAPVIPYAERSEIVGALKYVDLVVPQTTMDKFAAWEELRFDVMFVGDDWKNTPRWNALEAEFAKIGARIEYFPYTNSTSSTILREALNVLTQPARSS